MSKLIDAEKLDLVSYQGIPNGYKDSFDSGVLYAMNLIDDQPTIDAVPVVRCKDCKRCDTDTAHHKYFCMRYGMDIPGNWFCADGEKGEKVTE